MTDLHTAIALGIERGLSDLGGDLSNCTPSMLSHSVLSALLEAGPDLFASSTPRADSGAEVEWGYRSRLNPGLIVAPMTEEAARRSASGPFNLQLIRREVGPWIEVES
jgi:hypothetical protein